ncbi:helix-turn-helix domain-containing protein [Streptomyces niveus]|uniref:ATP-binding protein n=1 Tax=Streptomyces niveus TaxID=193462 RepID=UPI0035DCCEAB
MSDAAGPARGTSRTSGKISFAALLRDLREARSLTQQELATAAGVSVDAVSALERGRRTQPQPHTVRALATALRLRDADRLALLASLGRAGNDALEMPSRTLTPRRPSPPGVPVVGRDDEVAETVAALGTTPGRLVTLTGPGGVGKTTIALVAAHVMAEERPDTVYFADLTDVTEPDDALAAVARAAACTADTVTGLAEHLAGTSALLVLDNLERVTACGPQLAELLMASPDTVILTTSRVPLRVRREHEVRIAPLGPSAAEQLFGERLAAAGAPPTGRADDSAVARLCRRADGLPLAIELLVAAAARLGPRALLERIDGLTELPVAGPQDLPARQRTMAATIEWSRQLLGPAAQRLLPRLAMMPGSFSLDTVDAIAAPDATNTADATDAVGSLAELIEHSLVVRGDDTRPVTRYRMLEPVRRHAVEILGPVEREHVRRGVARWALRAGREHGAAIRGRGDMTAVEQVEADRHVLRLGFDHLVDTGRYDEAAGLLWSLWLPLWMTGHTHEGLAWTDRLHEDDLSEQGRARWLVARAGSNRVAADLFTTAERAMRLAERIDDASLAAEAAIFASAAALRLEDFDGSRTLLARAEVLMRKRLDVERDVWAAVHVPIGHGDGALLRGDRAAAARHWRVAADTARKLDSEFSVPAILAECAQAARGEGRLDDAAVMLAAVAELVPERDGHKPRAHLAGVAAAVAADLGDVASARWWEGVGDTEPAPDSAEFGARFRELVRRADTVTGWD